MNISNFFLEIFDTAFRHLFSYKKALGNTITVTNDAEKANVFAEYFSKVFTHESVDAFEKLHRYDITHVLEKID